MAADAAAAGGSAGPAEGDAAAILLYPGRLDGADVLLCTVPGHTTVQYTRYKVQYIPVYTVQ